jgi:uncharacterized protein YjbI with pentapeptide repeats
MNGGETQNTQCPCSFQGRSDVQLLEQWATFRTVFFAGHCIGRKGLLAMNDRPKDYRPPATRAELERRYAAGERFFPDTELSDADLSGIVLDGADFEKHSWFSDANFSGASLRGTSFRECNVKCADFSNADLTSANFELAAIESIKAKGALLEGIKVEGATFYGRELATGDALPTWERS